MDADGHHPRQLTHPREGLGETDGGQSWSPNGKKLLFSRSSPTAQTELYVVPARGGRARPLHVLGGGTWGPKRIAYVNDEFTALWTMNPDGSHRQKVASGKGLGWFAWSHDGEPKIQ